MYLLKNLKITAKNTYLKEISELSAPELHNVISKVIMGELSENWHKTQASQLQKKQAFYFSAEFLMGRMIQNNLLAHQFFPMCLASLLVCRHLHGQQRHHQQGNH